LTVALRDRWLVASFDSPVRACSWAIVGGGLVDTRHVAWHEVHDADLRPPVDPRLLLLDRLRAQGLVGAVGLLTSRRVATYVQSKVGRNGVAAHGIATVGLGNALRVGDPPGVAARIGTINLFVHIDSPLSDEALIEASAIATEAKSAIVLEAGVMSRLTGRPATGTGTDCTVVSCARSSRRSRAGRYAGKHTAVGSLIGAAAESAVAAGVRRYLSEFVR
jgi:adenosylcobinamide amidohydrolase